jgi:methoxymalonate biosynthesis acyl carrier protein
MSPEVHIEKAPSDADVVVDEITRFLVEQTRTEPAADQDLFTTGVANSMLAMQLVVFIEQAFTVTVAGPDLQLSNFRTVKSMAALVERLQAEAAADSDV